LKRGQAECNYFSIFNIFSGPFKKLSSHTIFEEDDMKYSDEFIMKRNFKGNYNKIIDFSKPPIHQGKLNVQKKNKKFEPKLFKLIDKKLIFYRVRKKKPIETYFSFFETNKEDTPKGYYDLLEFFRISMNVYEENSKPALYSFCLQKYGKTCEFFSSKKEKVQTWMEYLKLYCISDNFKENYHTENQLGKGHFAEVLLPILLEIQVFLTS